MKEQTRDAATEMELAWLEWLRGPSLDLQPTDHLMEPAFYAGYRAGAASVSRKEVVERIEKLRSYATQEDDPHGCTPTWNAALDKAIEIVAGETNE